MIEASLNQLANVTNPFQGKTRKVLCVCSAGLLRSPTLANVLHKELGYNTRAVGTAKNFALIPLSEALIAWADEIVFTDTACLDYLDTETEEEIGLYECPVFVLDIPDVHNYGDAELEKACLEQYTCAEPINKGDYFK